MTFHHFHIRLIPLLCVIGVIYFGFHTIHGRRGYFRMQALEQELSIARETLKEKQQEKQLWEVKVSALSPKKLDLDQLEESASRVLNIVHKEDKIIFED